MLSWLARSFCFFLLAASSSPGGPLLGPMALAPPDILRRLVDSQSAPGSATASGSGLRRFLPGPAILATLCGQIHQQGSDSLVGRGRVSLPRPSSLLPGDSQAWQPGLSLTLRAIPPPPGGLRGNKKGERRPPLWLSPRGRYPDPWPEPPSGAARSGQPRLGPGASTSLERSRGPSPKAWLFLRSHWLLSHRREGGGGGGGRTQRQPSSRIARLRG